MRKEVKEKGSWGRRRKTDNSIGQEKVGELRRCVLVWEREVCKEGLCAFLETSLLVKSGNVVAALNIFLSMWPHPSESLLVLLL